MPHLHRHLPPELWQIIGSKLDSVADKTRFRAVCKSWTPLLPSRLPPWLMLSEFLPNTNNLQEEEEDDQTTKNSLPRHGFFSLGDRQIYGIDLPQLHHARCVGSTGNWIITIDLDRNMGLLNPFSRTQIQLPSVTTFEYSLDCEIGGGEDDIITKDYRDCFVWKAILSSPPQASGCIVMVIHHQYRMLSFARPGDDNWTTVQTQNWPIKAALGIEDVIFYKNRFVAVNWNTRLMICDIGDGSCPPRVSFVTDSLSAYYHSNRKHYLVEWMGRLLLVIKFVDNPCRELTYKTARFDVYQFSFAKKGFGKVKCLGDYALFLGFNTSIAVNTSDYSGCLRKNCIYFTDDYMAGYRGKSIPGGHDMGVFDLEDSTITPHYKGLSTSFYSPPVWIVPT